MVKGWLVYRVDHASALRSCEPYTTARSVASHSIRATTQQDLAPRRRALGRRSSPQGGRAMHAYPTLEVQVLSDVHLEFGRDGFEFPQTANVLALVGDIGDSASSVYESFLLEQASRFDKVFLLAGNHEFYHHSHAECIELIQQVCHKNPAKLVFLNQTAYDLDEGYVVLGCTLWSKVLDHETADVSLFLADNRHIQHWSVWQNNHQHSKERAWLEKVIKEVESAEKLAVVLTHHAPSFRQTSAREHRGGALSTAFATDLEHLLKLPVVMWAFGHTHYCSEQLFNGSCRLVSNQIGYPHEESIGYRPGLAISLE